jgi:hypothetical protein
MCTEYQVGLHEERPQPSTSAADEDAFGGSVSKRRRTPSPMKATPSKRRRSGVGAAPETSALLEDRGVTAGSHHTPTTSSSCHSPHSAKRPMLATPELAARPEARSCCFGLCLSIRLSVHDGMRLQGCMSPPPTPNTAALHEKVKRCMLEVEQARGPRASLAKARLHVDICMRGEGDTRTHALAQHAQTRARARTHTHTHAHTHTLVDHAQDLHRTCGEHPFFRSSRGRRCLRRVRSHLRAAEKWLTTTGLLNRQPEHSRGSH